MTVLFVIGAIFAVSGIVFAWLAACGALDQAEREAQDQERRAGTAAAPCPQRRELAQRSGAAYSTGRAAPRSHTKER